MYDLTKPDLVIHPAYYPTALSYNLAHYYNVLTLDTLTLDANVECFALRTDSVARLSTVMLAPHYRDRLKRRSGIKPESTSYWFGEPQQMYRVRENGPRYCIWTRDDPLTVCATHVDRCCPYDLFQAIQRAIAWASNAVIQTCKTIIVFDLDMALIDDSTDGSKLRCADKVLSYARNMYDLVVLWSHGSHLHVDEHAAQFTAALQRRSPGTACDYFDETLVGSTPGYARAPCPYAAATKAAHRSPTADSAAASIVGEGDRLFDLVLSNNGIDEQSPKNLLYLYNYFPHVRFQRATLFDDSIYNWTPEYERMIVPTTTDLRQALKVLW